MSGLFAFMRRLQLDKRDIVFFVGLLLLVAGVYLVYAPAALIVPGVILIAISLWGRG